MLLIGYLYGIRSERRRVDEVHLNLAYRWFCRLGLEGRVPNRSTFSKNRHGRFADGDVLRRVFEMVIDRCAAFGFVGGQAAAVDGSTIAADASRERKDQPEEMQKIWTAKEDIARPVREYLDQLATDAGEVQEGPQHKAPKYLSETDPQAAWTTNDGRGRFSYEINYLIDTDHGIIMDVEATPARLSQEIVAAKRMLGRSAERHAFRPNALAADKSYGTGPFLALLLKREIPPQVPVLDRKHQTDGKYDLSHFAYDAASDRSTCLEGHEMRLRKVDPTMRIKRYSAETKTCGACPIRRACTAAPARTVTRHMDEDARQIARDLSHTKKFAVMRGLP